MQVASADVAPAQVIPSGLAPFAGELATATAPALTQPDVAQPDVAPAVFAQPEVAEQEPARPEAALAGSVVPDPAPSYYATPVSAAPAVVAERRAELVDDSTAEIARAALADGIRRIAVEVRNSIDFYVSQGRVPVTRAVLCGPALDIQGFDAALSRELGIPITPGTVAVASSRAAGGVPPGMLAVAAGLSVMEGPK
jgi:hypothetical protein